VPNARAGEDVRILDLGGQHPPATSNAGHDWWLVTDEAGAARVAVMVYDDEYQLVDAQEVADRLDDYVQARDLLWTAAQPFEP
jgi:hypothetical protein